MSNDNDTICYLSSKFTLPTLRDYVSQQHHHHHHHQESKYQTNNYVLIISLQFSFEWRHETYVYKLNYLRSFIE